MKGRLYIEGEIVPEENTNERRGLEGIAFVEVSVISWREYYVKYCPQKTQMSAEGFWGMLPGVSAKSAGEITLEIVSEEKRR